MKSFYKRSAISLIVLGMAGSVCAAAPTKYDYNTWSPKFSGVFLGVEGLNLRPMNGDLDYVSVSQPDFTVPNGTRFNEAISTSYDWSWRVYGGIRFTENDDITLSWMQLRTSDNDAVSPQGNQPNGTAISTPRWLFPFGWVSVNGHVTFDLDDAYAVWGHTIYFNNPWSVRYAAGVEYAKLNSDMTVTADSGNPATTNVLGYEARNGTRGIGPRVEFDMTYHFPYGFAVFGKANGALLVSKREVSVSPTSLVDVDTIFNLTGVDYSDRHVVIPKFGMRLGASYSYVWGQAGGEGVCRTTSLMVTAGWQVESYIHAIERPDDGNSQGSGFAPDLFPSVGFSTTKTSNFSDQGLFVGIELGTDWV